MAHSTPVDRKYLSKLTTKWGENLRNLRKFPQFYQIWFRSSDLEKANVMWDWYNRRESSKVKDLFVGQLKSSLHCTHCEKTSVMYDPFWDLSVPVPSSPNCKLDKCLEMFVVKDVLDGNEMPYCDVSWRVCLCFTSNDWQTFFQYCKTTRKCIKGFTIQRFPKYLVIRKNSS